jgi:hypothetical protein
MWAKAKTGKIQLRFFFGMSALHSEECFLKWRRW